MNYGEYELTRAPFLSLAFLNDNKSPHFILLNIPGYNPESKDNTGEKVSRKIITKKALL